MKYKNGVIVGIKKVVDDEIERVVVSPIIERAITIVDAVSVAMTGRRLLLPVFSTGFMGRRAFIITDWHLTCARLFISRRMKLRN